MSIWVTSHRWLSSRPKVELRGPVLFIGSGSLARAFSFGRIWREIEVDPTVREIRFRRSGLFSGIEQSSINFKDVAYIEYRFDSFAREWGPWYTGFMRQDEIERYSIELVDHQDAVHELWTFIGEGSAQTGVFGVLMGDELWDMEGTQGDDSRRMVQALARIIEAPIGKPIMTEDMKVECPGCGRSISRFVSKCLYCGRKGDRTMQSSLQRTRCTAAAYAPPAPRKR